MKIYLKYKGVQQGPFTEPEMHQEVAAGRINPAALVWWEGQQDWVSCARTPFTSLQPMQPMPPAVYEQPIASPMTPPPQQVPTVVIIRESTPVPANINATIGGSRGSGMAMASLVCGLLAFVFWLPCMPAIILGHLARRAIRKDPTLTGGGMATSGMIIGYIIFFGGVISTLALLFGGALMVIIANAGRPH